MDSEFVCDQIQNTVPLVFNNFNNNFWEDAWNNSRIWKLKNRALLKLGSSNNNIGQIRDVKTQSLPKSIKIKWRSIRPCENFFR